jgi:caffeoylshikimate esterase
VYGVSMGGANVFNMCTIPQCKKLQDRISGAIMCAPMVKIADEMKPPGIVISLMHWLAQLMPLAPVTPVPDILNKCFREPSVYERARRHPLLYSKKPRLLTGLTLLSATDDINARMEELKVPLLVLHGGDDVVTDPKLSQVLHDRCSSVDKTINIYPKAWHDMLAGEPEYMRNMVYADIVSWMTSRC